MNSLQDYLNTPDTLESVTRDARCWREFATRNPQCEEIEYSAKMAEEYVELFKANQGV